jgi:hypothetical protein
MVLLLDDTYANFLPEQFYLRTQWRQVVVKRLHQSVTSTAAFIFIITCFFR